jgi:serine/threonine protein kinase
MPPSQDSEFPEPDSMTIDPANLGSVDPHSVEGIFLVALSKSGPERDAFLSVQCMDPLQRQRVEGLLQAYEQAGNFLQKPAVAAEATPIGQYLDQCALPGTLGKLGPYEILEEIGRGGMGVVFRAHDPKLQRIVAVKALAPELARLPSSRQRFLREARAAAAVSHPHVVTIFAVEGTEEASLGTERTTLPYLVMECIVGQTLHDKIKRVGALKVEEIVRISRQIAEGLTAAHKRGLIHRDIKPANILLENGVERVKITDFGLARTTSDGGITHTGEILGTPQCMSPEQARGEIVDQRSDLFSLGCVMYTICTGFSPFRADNMLAVMKKVCEATPRPIAQINPNLPEWLCELVHRLLEKEPEQRVQTANAVVEILEAQAIISRPRATQPKFGYESATIDDSTAEVLPSWLLTPVTLSHAQWLFRDNLLFVTFIAMVCGFSLADDSYNVVVAVPAVGAGAFGLLALVKYWRKVAWTWINWKSMISVPLGMFVGGMTRAWMISKSRSGVSLAEELSRNSAGWIFLAVGIWLSWLFARRNTISTQQREQSNPALQTTESSGSTLASGMLWRGLCIFAAVSVVNAVLRLQSSTIRIGTAETILLVGIAAASVGAGPLVQLFTTGVQHGRSRQKSQVIPHAADATAAPTKSRKRFPWVILEWVIVATLGIAVLSSLGFATVLIMSYLPAPDEIGPRAYCVIRTPVAENVKYVTIDGKRATLEPGGPGEWRTTATQGIREIYVAYDSDSGLNQERFFTTTANVAPGRTTVITAEPVMVRSLTRPPGIEAPTSVQTGRMRIPTTIPSDQTSTDLPINRNTASTDMTVSIPLADAVEVLTERASTSVASYSARDEVWIDEPGLIIRMRRESFEGLEEEQLEYCSNVTWGEGRFLRPKDNVEVTDIPAGRYQVLVQDLDYGWPLDRRGTITIGNELTVVHVKRSFQAHKLQSSGADRFPMSFRWAGRSYQIDTPDDVQIVNRLLAATAEKQNYITPDSFRSHLLFVEAVDVEINGGGHSLRHHRTLAKIDVQSSYMLAGFRSPLGVLAWNQKCVSPGAVFVPTQGLEMFVTDKLVGWGINGWNDYRPIAMDESLAMPLVVRRDHGFIRRLSDAPPENSSINGGTAYQFRWFDNAILIKPKSVPVVQRLVAAWADRQPDVPESELLQLGEASSWEELWTEGPEGSGAFSRPEFLVAGNAPGTWRMKEPPEGALTPN